MCRVDVEYPVPINLTFVCTLRTIEHCLVGQLALRVVIRGNHSRTYYPSMDKGVVRYSNLSFLQKRVHDLRGQRRLCYLIPIMSKLSSRYVRGFLNQFTTKKETTCLRQVCKCFCPVDTSNYPTQWVHSVCPQYGVYDRCKIEMPENTTHNWQISFYVLLYCLVP